MYDSRSPGIGLAYSEQVAGIEGGRGKVHPACKDVVAETVSYVESGAPFWWASLSGGMTGCR
jgi:hypothetical protein